MSDTVKVIIQAEATVKFRKTVEMERQITINTCRFAQNAHSPVKLKSG